MEKKISFLKNQIIIDLIEENEFNKEQIGANETVKKKKTKIDYKLGFQIMGIVIIALIAIIVTLVVYFFTGNIQSKPPETIAKEYNIKEETFANRSVFIITAKGGATSNKVIFYVHGGSYVGELYEEHWKFFKDLIEDTGMTLIVPDYPLAPQYQYTEVFDMVFPLYQEVTKIVEKENLIVMGDSAGGGMALGLLQKAGQEGINQPSKSILISPWLDVSMSNPEIDIRQEKDKMLSKEILRLAGIVYAGSEKSVKNYLVSPIYGPLEKLENVVIYTGTNDILNPDVHKLQRLAQQKRNRNTNKRNPRGSS